MRLELHAEAGEKRLDVGPDGFEVVCRLNVERDIQGVGGGAGELGNRLLDCGDQCGKCGHDLRCGFESLFGALWPLEDVLSSDFDSFFDIYQDVCHRDDSLFWSEAD